MEDKVVAGAGPQVETSRDPGATTGRWSTLVVSVVVAVVLSVTATLLLGGAFRPGTVGSAATAPCGAVSACCPAGATGQGGR